MLTKAGLPVSLEKTSRTNKPILSTEVYYHVDFRVALEVQYVIQLSLSSFLRITGTMCAGGNVE